MRDGIPVIKVLVTRKVPQHLLRVDDVIPRFIAGHPTDVEEIGRPTVQQPGRTPVDGEE